MEEVAHVLRSPELPILAAEGRHCWGLISCAQSSDAWVSSSVGVSRGGHHRPWAPGGCDSAHDHEHQVGPGLQEAATLLMIFMIRFAWRSCSCHFEVKIIFELQAIKKANIRKLSTAHLLPGRAGRFLRAQQGFVNQRLLDGVQGKPDSCVPHTPSPTCLPECPAPGDQSPLPLSCHLSRAQVLCRGLWKSSAIMLWYSTRVPCVCVSACVCSHVHVCASVCACVCACVRASMFLTFWLLSQSICPTKSQGPAREPHVGGALPTPQEQAPPQT